MNSVLHGSAMGPVSNETEPRGEDNETGLCHQKEPRQVLEQSRGPSIK